MKFPVRGVGIALAIVALPAVPANAQPYDSSRPVGGPFSPVAIVNAPFTADATTTITERFSDGSAHQYKVAARYYRDSQGRVRAEVGTPSGPYVVLATSETSTPSRFAHYYVVDPPARTYRTVPGFIAAVLFNGEGRAALPVTKVCFHNLPPVIANASDDERLKAVNARLSPDLGIVIESHRPGAVSVDYEVTNIERGEPRAELFEVPADYAMVRGSHDDPLVGLGAWRSPTPCKR